MLEKIVILAESGSGLAELKSGAALLGSKALQIVCGDLGRESMINYLPSIVAAVKENNPQLVLVEATRNGRLAAAHIASAMGTAVLTDMAELKEEDGKIVSRRMVYGGAAFKTESSANSVAVACVGAGVFEVNEAAEAEAITIKALEGGVRLIERRPKEGTTVNLAAAKNVVGVGRGLGEQENMKLAYALAQVINGEVGCSRPVAEEEHWLPEDQYIGVSGVKIKPNVYIACGISGQVQHLSGCADAKLLVAVNKDENAPIFENCDYGIVGDAPTIMAALTERLK